MRYVPILLIAGCGFSAPSDPGAPETPDGSVIPRCDVTGDPTLRLCVAFDPQPQDLSGYAHPVMEALDVAPAMHDGNPIALFSASSQLRFAESPDLDVGALTIDMAIAPTMAADSTQYWLLDNNTQYFMAYEGKKIRCGIGAQVADSGETKINPDGTWHHVACTFGADGTLRVFVDGSVTGCRSVATAIPTGGTLGTAIGANYGSGGYTDNYVGALDNVHVFARALAPADVCNAAHGTGCNASCPGE